MKFAELDTTVQKRLVELLNNHIATSVDIINQDSCLISMLMIPDSNQLISFQPKDGNTDVDKAYAFVVEKLKKENFTYALFSYSTQLCLSSGSVTDASKNYIFTSDGIEIAFYTPYTLKGIFKKSINIEQTIFSELKENIFD